MTAKVKVIEATANSDFDAIRQVYYVTWQDAYHGLISDDFWRNSHRPVGTRNGAGKTRC